MLINVNDVANFFVWKFDFLFTFVNLELVRLFDLIGA